MEATMVRKAVDKGSKAVNKSLKRMDKMAVPIERTAAKISPSIYVAVGVECCIASTALTLAGKHRWASMVGSWGTCSLLLGIYSKLQREHGS
jgi:hypothetical protein